MSRKGTLVEFGFRLPSAMDNRPLQFDEFTDRVQQVVFMSATPGPYELRVSSRVVEQIVRPTGLIDPEVEVRPTKGQVDDLIEEIRQRVEQEQRVLVTTLTKKMAEDLTDYLIEMGLRVRYLHSEMDTVQRIEILRDLRLGEFDVLVGINLLREGLDLPEVSLVAILDADKEGFLRSETSLIQTIGRAARNVDGTVLMYADTVTDSMKRAISETQPTAGDPDGYNRSTGSTRRPSARRCRTSCWRCRATRARRGRGHARPAPAPAGTRRAGDAPGRARAADPPARGGDARGGEGSAVRVRCPAPGRGAGTASRAVRDAGGRRALNRRRRGTSSDGRTRMPAMRGKQGKSRPQAKSKKKTTASAKKKKQQAKLGGLAGTPRVG